LEEKIFNIFFKKVILNVIKNEINKISSYNKDKYQIRKKFSDKTLLTSTKKLYYSKKAWFKDFAHIKGQEALLDQHKLAAIFMDVMLEIKPVLFNLDDDIESIPKEVLLINYYIAFKIGAGLIYTKVIETLQKLGKNEEIQKLHAKKSLHYPPVTLGHLEFTEGIAMFLYINDRSNIDFDYLSHSNFMYFLELYNLMLMLSPGIRIEIDTMYKNLEKQIQKQ